MIKRFCDRCETEMRREYEDGEANIRIQTLKNDRWRENQYSLCPKCRKALEDFITAK